MALLSLGPHCSLHSAGMGRGKEGGYKGAYARALHAPSWHMLFPYSSSITQVCMSTPNCGGAGKWSAGMVLGGENDDFDRHLTIPVHEKKNSF